MTYDLFIGDRAFSSWSLRGWLMFRKFAIPCRTHMVGLYAGTIARDLAAVAPARLVPAVRTPDGTVIGETLAIAETLAERHPGAGLWPDGPAARATARWFCAEMATGLAALRQHCPMQLLQVHDGFDAPPEVRADLARLETLWTHARSISGCADGPLFGAYTLTEVFFTPVAARIIGYDLPVSTAARAYCIALLADPAVRHWRRKALETTYDPVPYALDLPGRPWPEFA
jgi:glutathione S-transferase